MHFCLENLKPLQREPLVIRCGAVVRRATDAESTEEQFHADLWTGVRRLNEN